MRVMSVMKIIKQMTNTALKKLRLKVWRQSVSVVYI